MVDALLVAVGDVGHVDRGVDELLALLGSEGVAAALHESLPLCTSRWALRVATAPRRWISAEGSARALVERSARPCFLCDRLAMWLTSSAILSRGRRPSPTRVRAGGGRRP